MPEYMWLNNAWNGTLEFYQTTSGSELVQELDLREFKDSGIELDHYIDHTGRECKLFCVNLLDS